jgi:glycosyltransferase involved in cell wall biosynthesis
MTSEQQVMGALDFLDDFDLGINRIIETLRRVHGRLTGEERTILVQGLLALEYSAKEQLLLDSKNRKVYTKLLTERKKTLIGDAVQLRSFSDKFKPLVTKLGAQLVNLKNSLNQFNVGTSLVWGEGKSELVQLSKKYLVISKSLNTLESVIQYLYASSKEESQLFVNWFSKFKKADTKVKENFSIIAELIAKKGRSKKEDLFLSDRAKIIAQLSEVSVVINFVEWFVGSGGASISHLIREQSSVLNLDAQKIDLDLKELSGLDGHTLKSFWDSTRMKRFTGKDKMNILMLGIPFSIKSGVSRAVLNLSNRLMKFGANVIIMNHWWHRYYYWKKVTDNHLGERLEKAHVNISPYSLTLANVPASDQRYLGMDWAAKVSASKRLKGKYQFVPSVVHFHTHTFEYDNATQILLERLGNPPSIYTLHQLIPYVRIHWKEKLKLLKGELSPERLGVIRGGGYRGREKAQETLMKKVDAIVTISKSHKIALDFLYPEWKHKTYAIPNGVGFHKYRNDRTVEKSAQVLRKKYGGQKIMIYVGRLEKQKDPDDVFRAFERILETHPQTTLVLVGPEEKDRLLLQRYGVTKEVGKRIKFAGWCRGEDLAAHYKMADVLVQPLITPELYAMVVLEAVSVGLPVISCPGELTFGNCYGVENIVKTLKYIFDHESEVKKELRAKIAVVDEHYSEKSYVLKHLELYKQLIQGKKLPKQEQNPPINNSRKPSIITPVKSLAEEIDEIIKPHLTGDEFYSVCIKDLVDGVVEVAKDKDNPLILASMVKPYFGFAFLHSTKVDKKFNFGPNSRLNLRLMVAESNNRSTGWIVRQMGEILKGDPDKGPEAIQEILDKNDSSIFPKIQILENVPKSGKAYLNKASVWNHISFLTYLWENKDKNQICNEIFSLMGVEGKNRLIFDRFKLGTSIPPETQLYEKTGSNSKCIGEFGILIPTGPSGEEIPYAMAIVINSKSRKSLRYTSWRKSREEIIRKVSDHVYHYFMKKHGVKISKTA